MNCRRYLPRIFCILLFVLDIPLLCDAQGRFTLPVEGTLGTTYFLVNHVDHDPDTNTVRDYTCGIKTYDGHQGTDFVLRSFRAMDNGVYAIAADVGEVVAVVDTAYDRNKVSVVSRGFGNYIMLKHADGYYTYYAHLRKGSAVVHIGDRVKKSQRLGLIGSAGNSSDPHLHFEVWRNVDPFNGSCSDGTSLFAQQPEYGVAYMLIDHGLTSWPPLLDTIRERPPAITTISSNDTTITFWCLQQHVQPQDELGVEWIGPDNTTYYSYSADAGLNSAYYYWWTYINVPSNKGRYIAVYKVNGVEKARDTVQVGAATGIVGDATPVDLPVRIRYVSAPTPRIVVEGYPEAHIDVADMSGRMVDLSTPGPHVVRITIGSANIPSRIRTYGVVVP